MNEIPQPLPQQRSALRQVRWEFPFGNSFSQDSLGGGLRFVYTECETFSKAIEPRYRIILGRKGIGKTSLIKRIRLGNEYDVKVICEKDDLFEWVNATISNDVAERKYIEPYQEKCIDFYWISIFRVIAQEHPELKSVNKFLRDSKLSQGRVLAGIDEWAVANLQSESPITSVSAGLINAFLKKNEPNFEQAKQEAEIFLSDKKVVILIDNLERYLLENPRQQNVLAALLLSAVTFNATGNITVKCFIPSEYYTQLKNHSVNWGKLNQHITTLRWKDRELLTMLCKRLGFYLYWSGQENRRDLSVFADVNESLTFWKQYFASRIYNEAFQTEEPIIPYILRHTQLTPRQVIQLCNAIVKDISSFPTQVVADDKVRKGVEKWEKELCKEVFSSFQETYPYSEEFCTQYLRNLPMSFRIPLFRSKVYELIDDIDGKYSNYKADYALLERMLFDLGIVGMGLPPSNSPASSIYQLYNFAQFEPNCDGHLNPNDYTDLFFHPMFIHKINFIRDKNACAKPVCPIQAVETPETSYL